MQNLVRNGYSEAAVKAALHAPNRRLKFKYELLDKAGNSKGYLTTVERASIRYNSMAEIKRTAHFAVKDDGTIDFLSDRIKPYVCVRMPDGGYAEFPMGVFLLSTPPQKVGTGGVVIRDVEAYDLGQILQDDAFDDRYTVPAGTNYVSAVASILTSAGFTMHNLAPTTKTLPEDRDWEPGTPKAKIIDDLLTAINYRPLWFDENGIPTSSEYVSPAQRGSEYTYQVDDESVILDNGVERSLDLFKVPNKWILFTSEPDGIPLRSVYTNTNPNSPTSTVSRGRTIVELRQVDAYDQATLDAMAERIAFEASQVFEKVTLETAIMPMHSHDDVITLEYPPFGISAKYSETGWEFELRAGATMKHEIRRIVTI